MTLSKDLEEKFGSQMGEWLELDFGIIEAATEYLKEHKGEYRKNKVKKIFDKFINNHAPNQLDIQGRPLFKELDNCFEAWWKGQPAPRTIKQQEKDYKRDQFQEAAWEEPRNRVKRLQDDIELHEQMYGGQEDEEGQSCFQIDNPALAELLLKRPEDIKTAFMSYFKGVTTGQLDGKLKESGILDKAERNNIKKYLLDLCNDESAIATLTDNELLLGIRDAAQWMTNHMKNKTIYVYDSQTRYYLNGNKYVKTPPTTDEEGNPIPNPIEEARSEYINYLITWKNKYPLFSKAINRTIKEVKKIRDLYPELEITQNHTEAELNKNILTEGYFCTPNGLYNYTHKISDSNGLTKVTTNANIKEGTDEEIKTSTGAQLWQQFLNSIQPNPAINDYLECVIANIITGHRENEHSYILYGATGSNGKSVLMAFLQHMLGDYYSDYNTDSLARNTRGETAEQAAKNLENRRLVGGREIGEGSILDSGKFKQYFSNDSYRINEKFKPAYYVQPTHTLILPVNQIPNMGGESAIYRRIIVIPFTQHFVDNPTKPNEQKKDNRVLKSLIAHEDEIFTYLVRIAEQFRKENFELETPAIIQNYTNDMLDKNNILVDITNRELVIQTREQRNDPNTLRITSDEELYERYIEALPHGAYNSYKTTAAYVDALLLKYPQDLKHVQAYATDGKLHWGIAGIWLRKDTTAAIQQNNKRKDIDGMPCKYLTFKNPLNTKNEKNKNISKDNVKTILPLEKRA